MQAFREALNKSNWAGFIFEAGIGLEFSAQMVTGDGASKNILGVECDYAAINVRSGVKAVSLENVKEQSQRAFNKARQVISQGLIDPRHGPNPDAKPFGLVISGRHNHEASHAWIALTTPDWTAHMHLRLPAGERDEVSKTLAENVEYFVGHCLFPRAPWSTLVNRGHHVGVDVIQAPGLSEIEHLMLLGSQNPLVYHHGQFQRVEDYLRQTSVIFPGSFNPPTAKHLKPNHVLYEITQTHCYKGSLSLLDLYHRMKMLDAAGKPVLLTSSPRFIDKDEILRSLVNQDYTYLIGADAWNATIAHHQYPNEEWLGNKLKGSRFRIQPRPGVEISENQVARHLSHVIIDGDNDEHNSTAVRTSDNPSSHPFLTDEVADYIRRMGLYQS
jgi:nicotinic acid mononucleotide adenylyltransferase